MPFAGGASHCFVSHRSQYFSCCFGDIILCCACRNAYVPPLSIGQTATLPVVMPLGAAMAACSQLLEIRYGEKSNGLVTCRDAEVPDSVVVRPKCKLCLDGLFVDEQSST
ncbi:alpha/beta-Hydrolases superfamily protein [Abeliophyllum distichum]|uniref:Alpha/beta-Hydrolases superfamily protein n=1 Tax=Abeliophyllum distichum TaxID=126358 RepID=A0ABD1RR54_9LAMI